MDYILSLITFLPLIGALIIGLFVQGSGSQSSENAKRVSLVTSIIVFLLGLVMFSEFDKHSSDFQFVEEFLSNSLNITKLSRNTIMEVTRLTLFAFSDDWDPEP